MNEYFSGTGLSCSVPAGNAGETQELIDSEQIHLLLFI
jgi:hypothetical protein